MIRRTKKYESVPIDNKIITETLLSPIRLEIMEELKKEYDDKLKADLITAEELWSKISFVPDLTTLEINLDKLKEENLIDEVDNKYTLTSAGNNAYQVIQKVLKRVPDVE